MVDLYGKLVGKYTSPMDPMGVDDSEIWRSPPGMYNNPTRGKYWDFNYQPQLVSLPDF